MELYAQNFFTVFDHIDSPIISPSSDDQAFRRHMNSVIVEAASINSVFAQKAIDVAVMTQMHCLLRSILLALGMRHPMSFYSLNQTIRLLTEFLKNVPEVALTVKVQSLSGHFSVIQQSKIAVDGLHTQTDT